MRVRSLSRRRLLWALAIVSGVLFTVNRAELARAETARGVVFDDQNGNGVRDDVEPGLACVRVSNGLDIVKTDAAGRYALSVDDDTIVFVIKPRDWQTHIDSENLPRFYYIHKPAGSPDDDFQYAGVAPTGPLPASIDFPLTASADPNEFTVIVMGDPQPRTCQEVRFYANDVVAELVDTTAAFGMSMGDIVGDDLSLFEAVNAVQGLIGVPWYNILGNHDMNFRSPNDKYSDESFERVYGPPNYAFQYGQVHFVVLDNVYWNGPERTDAEGKQHGGYEGRLTLRQLQFTANYLQFVPQEERVIICMHIPLPAIELQPEGFRHGTPQYRRLLEILSGHPHTMSFSAHTHFNHHSFAGADQGYTPKEATEHHHHNVATGSGSWYGGPLGEQGFPVTTMADGAPNGYILATFQGNEYRLRYKAARMPADYQLSIHAPEVICGKGDDIKSDDVKCNDIESDDAAEVVVNVFNGNGRSRVRMRVRGQGDWKAMEQSTRTDPVYAAAQERDVAAAGNRRRPLPEPKLTEHIWVAKLPTGLPAGMHVLEVEATDMFGHVDRGIRILEVE